MTTITWPDGGVLLWPVPVLGDFKAWRPERQAALLAQTSWTMLVWNEAVVLRYVRHSFFSGRAGAIN
jgi:hypothetical protein